MLFSALILILLQESDYWRLAGKAQGKKILIDHHQQPEQFDFAYSDTVIPATSQMIYHFIEAMDDENW
jgi:nanoRNase/pAp phosphatase (c-di-AMP/oligoRNAs hydrolase)